MLTNKGPLDSLNCMMFIMIIDILFVFQRKGRTTPIDKKMMMKRSQSESDTLE